MTPIDAVVAAEAVLGRQLSTEEMARVRTVLAGERPRDETWKRLFDTLEISMDRVADHLLKLEAVSAANARDHDAVVKALYDNDISRCEAVLGRRLAKSERERAQIALSRNIDPRAKWALALHTLEVFPEAIARRALLLQVKAAATDGDYEAVVEALRDDAGTRLKRAGWVY